MPSQTVLPVNITRKYAKKAPIPKLELGCEITNPTEFNICILDAWVEVEATNGLEVDEGKLFKSSYARANPAVIPSHGTGNGDFVIKLPLGVLHSIEERRAGGNLELKISSWVLVAKVLETGSGSFYLDAPYETSFGKGFESELKYQIPQSEWAGLLENLGWSETELIELPTRILRANRALAFALEQFEAAQEYFRSAEWSETLSSCRMVFEAAAREASKTDDMEQGLKILVQGSVSNPAKAEHLHGAFVALAPFLHLANHEVGSPVTIKRIDAQLALQLTGAFLAYLGYTMNE